MKISAGKRRYSENVTIGSDSRILKTMAKEIKRRCYKALTTTKHKKRHTNKDKLAKQGTN